MEQIIQDYAMKKRFMGSVLVARDGKILLDKSFGSANLEWDIPNSPTTKFQIASLTKQFTAACIFLLEERGKLNVNDPVRKYLPEAPTAWENITIYNLLTHTSGIPNSYDGITSWRQTKTPEQLVASFRNKPLDFQPGEKYRYSNAGYYLLGYLIEKISGQSYESFLRQNIFKPLGMNDSGYDSNSEIIQRRASGYHLGKSQPENSGYYDVSLRFSAGGIYSTTEDLLRWEQGLLGGKLLSSASLKKMTTPFKNDYACGLTVSNIDGHRAIDHSGNMDGFNSEMVYYPDDNLTIILISNLGGDPKSIALKLASVAHGEKVVLPWERKEVTILPATLARYVGSYYDLIPNYNMVVSVENGYLMAQVTGDKKRVLVAESDKVFFEWEIEGEYEFVSNDKGEITSVLYTQGGHKLKGIRK
jgi:CubicO group peptidase (beta-lactamase class C family)